LKGSNEFDALKPQQIERLQQCGDDGEQINQSPKTKNVAQPFLGSRNVAQVVENEDGDCEVLQCFEVMLVFGGDGVDGFDGNCNARGNDQKIGERLPMPISPTAGVGEKFLKETHGQP